MQFSNQTSHLLTNNKLQSDKPAIAMKDSDSIASSSRKHSEQPLHPAIMASSVSVQSEKPPPYFEAAYVNEGYVDDAVPGPSNLENLTLDVPAVPQRKVCLCDLLVPFNIANYLSCLYDMELICQSS